MYKESDSCAKLSLFALFVFALGLSLVSQAMASQTQTNLDLNHNLEFNVVTPPAGVNPEKMVTFKMNKDGSLKMPMGTTRETCTTSNDGSLWIDKTTSALYLCNNTKWIQIGGSVVLSSNYRNLSGEGTYTDTVNLSRPGVLSAHCYGLFSVNETSLDGNTGTLSTIIIDGSTCSEDNSFNFPSNNVHFYSTSSCNMPLSEGSHTISCMIYPYGVESSYEYFGAGSFGYNIIAR